MQKDRCCAAMCRKKKKNNNTLVEIIKTDAKDASSTRQFQDVKRDRRHDHRNYRAMATTTAPPTMAITSRVKPVVRAAAPVCRPGAGLVPVAVESVALGCTTVVAVTVLILPSGRVVVLW